MMENDKEPEIRQLENLMKKGAKFAAFSLAPFLLKWLGKGVFALGKLAYRGIQKARGKSPVKKAIKDGKAEEKTASLERRKSSVKDKSKSAPALQKSASRGRSMKEITSFARTQSVELNAAKAVKAKGIKRTMSSPAL